MLPRSCIRKRIVYILPKKELHRRVWVVAAPAEVLNQMPPCLLPGWYKIFCVAVQECKPRYYNKATP